MALGTVGMIEAGMVVMPRVVEVRTFNLIGYYIHFFTHNENVVNVLSFCQ